MRIENKVKIILGVILYSFIGTICLPGILAASGDYLWYTNSFFAVFFFAINIYVLYCIYPNFHRAAFRHKLYAVLFALCLSFALHFGARLEADSYITFTDIRLWVSSILFAGYLAIFIHVLWDKISSFIRKKKEVKTIEITQNRIQKLLGRIIDTPWMTWLTLFILWIPTFLAFFPGAFVYDAQDEYVQVASRVFTTHHPLLHVLLLGVPIRAAEHFGLHSNVGIACYTIFQMIVMSLIFTYVLYLMKKWNSSRIYRGITLVILGFFPIYPMYAVCSAKDTLFTGALLLIIAILIDFTRNGQEKNIKQTILFITVSVCMMLLRNNGLYAYILSIPILLLFNRKKFGKTAIVMLLSVFLFFIVSQTLKISLNATDSERQEMLTVPIQQITRAYEYAPEAFTEEEKEILFEILSPEALDTYAPRISDIVKSQFNNQAYKQNPQKYQKLWLTIGLRKPFVYMNAWLLTSYGYWYPDAVLNSYGGIQRFTFQYRDSSYFGFETELPGERHSMFPLLETFYRNISLEMFQQRIPVVSMLFSPGLMFWIFAFVWIGLLREKKRDLFAVLSIVFLLYLTVLLGPTSLVRYMLILWFILPVLFNKDIYSVEL